ncbi:MAG: Crp/Fnr family transcriptional regulator [Rhizobiaceae bacterium]|nr:Crp/Fnr family transcriptional regulator [Rhizobiaceae bacterium]
MVKRAKAESILRESGWLSQQPPAFQDEVLRRSILLHFPAGEVIYRFGDDLGGIFGLVDGVLTVNTAPPDHTPQLIHVGAPGAWTGEGCFLTRQPRRLELRALVETWMMHVPLDQMDQMAAADPSVVRNFSHILMASVEVLIRIVHDLQIPDAARRIASVLNRAAWIGQRPIRLTQSEIGLMANASRKQVNATLSRFARIGWVKTDYRSITILDVEAVRQFAVGDD